MGLFIVGFLKIYMAPLVGLEPTTHGVEDRYSIQLSYKGKWEVLFEIVLTLSGGSITKAISVPTGEIVPVLLESGDRRPEAYT